MMRRILILLILTVLLVGCGRTTPVVPTTAPTTDVITTTGPTETTAIVSTEVPTSTPTLAPGLVLIGGTDTAAPDILSTIETLAAESGWTVETALTIDTASLRPETQVIVWLGDPAEARTLADAAPQVRVIAFTPQVGEASANLSWVVSDTDQQAFA